MTVFFGISPRSLLQTFHTLQMVSNVALMKLHAPSNFDYFLSKIYRLSNYKLFDTAWDITYMMINPEDYITDNSRFIHIGHYETASFLPNLGSAATIFLLLLLFAPLSHATTVQLMRR